MITFSVESWSSYYPEGVLLWADHADEVYESHDGRMQLAPDINLYETLDKNGYLHITVARHEGVMVGYCLVVVRPHMHFRYSVTGFEDSYFLSKPYRKGLNGVKLLRASIESLRSRGVERVYFQSRPTDSSKILRYLGMEKMGEVYSLWLKE